MRASAPKARVLHIMHGMDMKAKLGGSPGESGFVQGVPHLFHPYTLVVQSLLDQPILYQARYCNAASTLHFAHCDRPLVSLPGHCTYTLMLHTQACRQLLHRILQDLHPIKAM